MSEPGLLNGEVLDGKYQIEQLLGQGGMEAVYRALHLGTKHIIAFKAIPPYPSRPIGALSAFEYLRDALAGDYDRAVLFKDAASRRRIGAGNA